MRLIKIFILAIICINLTACFNTRDKRKKPNPFDLSLLQDDNPYGPETTPEGTPEPTPTDNPGENEPPAHIAHCNWSQNGSDGFEFNSSHLGQYTLCQSTNGEKELYLQMKTNPGYNICLIPVNEDSGNVVYIGEPRCVYANDPMTVYKIDMLKNRPSSGNTTYSSLSLTGVMMMQDRAYLFPYPYNGYYKSPDAYMVCANWYQMGYPQYCQTFNSAGNYIYHKF